MLAHRMRDAGVHAVLVKDLQRTAQLCDILHPTSRVYVVWKQIRHPSHIMFQHQRLVIVTSSMRCRSFALCDGRCVCCAVWVAQQGRVC